MGWEVIEDEELEKLRSRRRRREERKRRWNTIKLYNDLISIPPGKEAKLSLKDAVKMYAIDLSGMDAKRIKKSLRGRLRTAMRKGIIDEFSTFGDLIIIKRSEIPAEDLRELIASEEELEELEEL